MPDADAPKLTQYQKMKAKEAALEAEIVRLKAALESAGAATGTVTTGPADVSPVPVSASGASAFDSDEWRFLQQAIAETEIDFRSGAMTGMSKKMFHLLVAKLTLWRTAREIVAEIGIGCEWPQWISLKRSDDTGRKLSSVSSSSSAPPKPEADVPAPNRTTEGMPIRHRDLEAPDELRQLAMAVKNAIRSGAPAPAPV